MVRACPLSTWEARALLYTQASLGYRVGPQFNCLQGDVQPP